MPPIPTDPIGLGLGPGGRHQARRLDGDGRAGRRLATGQASRPAATRRCASSTPSRPGCIETIVGGVTGFYLGG